MLVIIRASVALTLFALVALPSAAAAKARNLLIHHLSKRCDSSIPAGFTWANNWDGPVKFNCPHGQSINFIGSLYRTCKRDRIWKYSCQTTPAAYSCSTTNYVNDWDRPMIYMCPHNGVVSGIESTHDNTKEDRRFKIKCCRSTNYITYDCTSSSYMNSWQDRIHYNVPKNHVMVGLFSYHDNNQEDRLWMALICRVRAR